MNASLGIYHRVSAGGQVLDDLVFEVRKVLDGKSVACRQCARLPARWNGDEEQVMLPIAYIARHPSALACVSYDFCFLYVFRTVWF